MKQKTTVLYFGKTHHLGRPFFATTANGANTAGKTLFKVDVKKKDIARLQYLIDRVREK